MKVIKVHNCMNCPYYIRRLLTPEKDWCSDSVRYFEVSDTIPDWCKLEDLDLRILLDMKLSKEHDENDCDICKCPHR